MKTKKENKDKNCKKCGISYNKKDNFVWAIKFPYWICRECGLAAKNAIKKIDDGKFKDGISELIAVNWGISTTKAKSELKKTRDGLKNKQTRATAYQSMRKKGMSDLEIKTACVQSGWPDITK